MSDGGRGMLLYGKTGSPPQEDGFPSAAGGALYIIRYYILYNRGAETASACPAKCLLLSDKPTYIVK